MPLPVRWIAAALVLTALCAAGRSEEPSVPTPFARLTPLHAPLAQPKPGEWLWHHQEPGQTFSEYTRSDPVKPDAQRRVLYIQPLGTFSGAQQRILNRTAEYMHLYFGLPVTKLKTLSLDIIPRKARRKHPSWGMDQILSTYVLDQVLIRRVPRDAVAVLALTASDLWPGEGWNFVFGQASLKSRVGVWSIYRNGDPEAGEAAFRLCLRRTLKTATHETGHMFSMLHCTAYECNMCGSNHRVESDRHPLWLCPVCLAKLTWATRAEPIPRYQRLAAFCTENGFTEEAEFFRRSITALKGD
jgi:archaemetzincin